MKNLIIVLVFVSTIFATGLKTDCEKKSNFLYIKPECIQTYTAIGEQKNSLIVLLHGMWKPGANVIGIYGSFAEDLSMQTDKTVVAIAQPGYSGSSTYKFEAIMKNKKQTKSKKYLQLLSNIFKQLKLKHKAKNLIVVAHSAGASMTTSIMTKEKNLIQTAVLAGGKYKHIDINKLEKKAKYILVYGDKDKISPPAFSVDFHKKLKNKNFDTVLMVIKDSGHAFLDMDDKVVDILTTIP
ncbi:MAG: hypothetical protein B1H07_03315 [Campylobacteraceae bacterium 4484_166]|nr:MAG: hypothetical protein B1H07_03315 [Campylobacteraceae bacterium 4484_166]